MKIFKHGFWFWLARRAPQSLRYHVLIMCTADYSVAFPTTEVPATRAMDIAKWIEPPHARKRSAFSVFVLWFIYAVAAFWLFRILSKLAVGWS